MLTWHKDQTCQLFETQVNLWSPDGSFMVPENGYKFPYPCLVRVKWEKADLIFSTKSPGKAHQ